MSDDVLERLTEHESLVAAQTRDLIVNAMTNSERSRWAASHKIGVSDIGHCREYLRRVLTQEEAVEGDAAAMPAFIGTALGDLMERHTKEANPEALIQQSVTVSLTVGQYQLNLPGHPDVILPKGHGNEVRDFKSKDHLTLIKRSGPTTQQRFQLALYGRAAIDAGLVEEDGLVLSLVYLDRSGADGPTPEVFSWRFDHAEVEEARDWLGDVFYAIENDEEASRDQARTWCEMWCKFAETCRGGDTDVTGLIEDEEMILAMKVYSEAQKAESRARRDKDSAKSVLRGVNGHTASHTLRWVSIPAADIPATTRRGYEKIDLKERKGRP